MREIKFRAWDTISKRWLDPQEIHINLVGEWYNCESDESGSQSTYLGEEKHIKLMQYTGLKDKKGKEIYEGDIVLVNTVFTRYAKKWDYYDAVKCDVRYVAGCAFEAIPFTEKGRRRLADTHGNGLFDSKNIEVIGNIYENPELMKR